MPCLRKAKIRLSNKWISTWLTGKDAYTLHKMAPIKYKRKGVVVPRKLQTDQGEEFLYIIIYIIFL